MDRRICRQELIAAAASVVRDRTGKQIMMVDISLVEQYVTNLLVDKLPERFDYHNLEHTLDVAQRALFYAGEEGICEKDVQLLHTAALFHDTGFTRTYDGHEDASVQIAREALPTFSYTESEIDTIARMINATCPPQHPCTLLEEILCDADMDSLGREDFLTRADSLRRELRAICGLETSDQQWHDRLGDLLASYVYFTPSARNHRDAGKAQNLLVGRAR